MKEILELERRHVARQGPIPSAARPKPRTAHVPGPKKLVGSSRFTLNHLGHVAHPKLKPHNIAVGDKGEVRRSDTGTVASVLVQVPLGTCTIVYPQTGRHGKVLAQESQSIFFEWYPYVWYGGIFTPSRTGTCRAVTQKGRIIKLQDKSSRIHIPEVLF